MIKTGCAVYDGGEKKEKKNWMYLIDILTFKTYSLLIKHALMFD